MKSSEIFFSIIIPVWNRAELITETLRSVIDQNNVNLEVIVVDDGSTDNTGTVVAAMADPRLKYIRIPNSERGAARNAGMALAEGKYINYFDSDDIFDPCLAELAVFIMSENSPPVIFGAIRNISETGEDLGIVLRRGHDFKRDLLYNNFLACGSVFIRRDVAIRFPFSEDRKLSGAEDWELWLRIFTFYNFTESPFTIFSQRHHALRSLTSISTKQVIERETAFMNHILVLWTTLERRFTKPELNLFLAERMTFMALAQSEQRDRSKSLQYLLGALKRSFMVVKRKRTWAVARHLIFNGHG